MLRTSESQASPCLLAFLSFFFSFLFGVTMLLESNPRETCFADELMSLEGMGEGGALQKAGDDLFEEMQNAFLPRLELKTSNSKECKAGEFPVNHYALKRDQTLSDLGPNVDVFVCGWRPMALSYGEDTFSVHDPRSAIFKEVQANANAKVDGNMWGYQTLLWVPAADSFATYFAGSPTARRAFPSLKSLMNSPCTFGSQKIVTDSFTWFGATHSECSTKFPLPLKEAYDTEVEKFQNPSTKTPELAKDDGRAQ